MKLRKYVKNLLKERRTFDLGANMISTIDECKNDVSLWEYKRKCELNLIDGYYYVLKNSDIFFNQRLIKKEKIHSDDFKKVVNFYGMADGDDLAYFLDCLVNVDDDFIEIAEIIVMKDGVYAVAQNGVIFNFGGLPLANTVVPVSCPSYLVKQIPMEQPTTDIGFTEQRWDAIVKYINNNYSDEIE